MHMLKILITFCLGVLCGAFALISAYVFIPSIHSLIKPWLIGKSSTAYTSSAMQFNDRDEGQKRQSIDYIDEEEYRSTDGNSAELFKLKHGCKIKVSMIGETAYAYHVVYFHQKKLQHMQSTEYRTSWMQAVSNATENELNALYTTEIFNPKSALSQAQFDTLIGYFEPKLIAQC